MNDLQAWWWLYLTVVLVRGGRSLSVPTCPAKPNLSSAAKFMGALWCTGAIELSSSVYFYVWDRMVNVPWKYYYYKQTIDFIFHCRSSQKLQIIRSKAKTWQSVTSMRTIDLIPVSVRWLRNTSILAWSHGSWRQIAKQYSSYYTVTGWLLLWTISTWISIMISNAILGTQHCTVHCATLSGLGPLA